VDRRKFLRNSALITLGSMVIPPQFMKGLKAASVENMIKPASNPNVDTWKDDEINIAWIGHATVLINFYGKIILTDPVFFEAVGIYIEVSSSVPKEPVFRH
jgi:hypothetical protein